MMEENHSHVTERIFNLTLEIIYLLTGEKYAAVKMTAIESLLQGMCPAVSGLCSSSRNGSAVTIPSPYSLISGKNNKKKIVEVTNKITELLSGEVPIRCQDVTVYFSMEARRSSEGHKSPNKNIKVESHQTLTSPDVSSNRNPPERCTGPLYSRDCPQEGHSSTQQYQEQMTIKTEMQEEADETPVRNNALQEEKGILEINTAEGQNISRTSEEPLISSPTSEEDYDGTSNYFPGENAGAPNIHREEYSFESNANTLNVQQRLCGLDAPFNPPSDMASLANNSHFAISNIRQELYSEDQSSGLANLEESTHGSVPVTSNIQPEFLTRYGPPTHSTHEESSPCAMIQPTLQTNNEIYPGSNSWNCIPTLAYQNEHHQRTQKCGQSFRSFNHRSTAGQKRFLGKKLFPCTECGKCFNHSLELIKHQQEHRKVRPYSCSECGRSYTQKSHLLNHQRLHTGVNTFLCSVCGRCFTLKSQLIQHMRSHTGEKPFSCTECGRCFAKKSNLDNHQTVHTGHRPFSCPVCGKQLARKTTLRQHLRAHAGDL